MKLNWASINLMQNTVGDRDVGGLASSESKYRPASAEIGVCHRDVAAAPKESASIIE
jgi:hypothetical protein